MSGGGKVKRPLLKKKKSIACGRRGDKELRETGGKKISVVRGPDPKEGGLHSPRKTREGGKLVLLRGKGTKGL